jgi:predicted phage terminase large subunit-like protein
MKLSFRDIAHRDFLTFLAKVFREHHGEPLELAAYIRYVAAELDRFAKAKGGRLCIKMPPRHLKTETAIAFMAYLLGHDPHLRIMVLSFSESLAKFIAGKVRGILKSKWYKEVFRTRIAADHGEITDFETDAGGGLFATHIGGGFTGRGADLIVIDDPVDIPNAGNIELLEKVNSTFDGPIMSRLNSQTDGRVLIIAHRLSEFDLCGHVLAQGGSRHVALALVAPKTKVHRINDTQSWTRKKGELLRPDAVSKKDLARLQRPSFPSFEVLYQQNVAQERKLRLKPEHFGLFSSHTLPIAPVVISVDPGFASGKGNSHTVIQVWTRDDDLDFLIDQWREQAEFEEAEAALQRFYRRYRPARILIERTGFGSALGRRPKVRKIIDSVIPDGRSKIERLYAHIKHIRSGRIQLPKSAELTDAFIEEFVNFPAGEHDDQVDATTQYLDFMATSPRLPTPGAPGTFTRGYMAVALGSQFPRF